MIEIILNIGCWVVAFFFAWVGLTLIVTGLWGFKANSKENETGIALLWLTGASVLRTAWWLVQQTP